MQYRFFNFAEDDATFLLNARLVGILAPGTYRGFDFIQKSANWNLLLEHGTSGVVPVDSLALEGPPRGVLLTRQGAVIMEDEPIILAIAPADLSNNRIDLIVCNHRFAETPGGRPANYSVVVGVPGAGIPVLPKPGQQTVVGTLTVPVGASSLADSQVEWVLNRPELAGRPAYVLPATVAHWTKAQQWELPQKFSGVGLSLHTSNKLSYDDDTGQLLIETLVDTVFNVDVAGDIRNVFVSPARRGEVFYLRFTAATRLVKGSMGSAGALLLPKDTEVAAGDGAWFMVLPAGEWLLLTMQLGDAARLSKPNRFNRLNSERRGSILLSDYGPQGVVQIRGGKFEDNGNHFLLPMPIPTSRPNFISFLSSAPEGTEITVTVPQSGRQANTLATDTQIPNWAWFDSTNQLQIGVADTAQVPVPAGMMPIRFITSEGTQSRTLTANNVAGATYRFLALNGQWLLIGNSESALPQLQRDRRKVTIQRQRPFAFPDNGSDQLFNVAALAGGARDYIVSVTLWLARITTAPELALTFARQGSAASGSVVTDEFSTGFLTLNGNGSSITVSGTWLFEQLLPGEQIVVRLKRRDGTTDQVNVYDGVMILDGTPGRSQ